eukprot:m.114053 g.114053  ORF g.114053 m.114053 type:complete len:80 (-) comp9435_c0_seq2:132-371(-)
MTFWLLLSDSASTILPWGLRFGGSLTRRSPPDDSFSFPCFRFVVHLHSAPHRCCAMITASFFVHYTSSWRLGQSKVKNE